MTTETFNPNDWIDNNPSSHGCGYRHPQHSETVHGSSYGNPQSQTTNSTHKDIEVITQRIESYELDLTANYQDWLSIGFALADELGEAGRGYFQRLSRFHHEYSASETDQQFDHCLKGRKQGVSIKTFFYLAQSAGINIKV